MTFLLPSVYQSVISVLYSIKSFKTNQRLYNKHNIHEDDILKIIRKLDVNKVHDQDDISITKLSLN